MDCAFHMTVRMILSLLWIVFSTLLPFNMERRINRLVQPCSARRKHQGLTFADLNSSSKTSDKVGCAWTANLMSCKVSNKVSVRYHIFLNIVLQVVSWGTNISMGRLRSRSSSKVCESSPECVFPMLLHWMLHGWGQQRANQKYELQGFLHYLVCISAEKQDRS